MQYRHRPFHEQRKTTRIVKLRDSEGVIIYHPGMPITHRRAPPHCAGRVGGEQNLGITARLLKILFGQDQAMGEDALGRAASPASRASNIRPLARRWNTRLTGVPPRAHRPAAPRLPPAPVPSATRHAAASGTPLVVVAILLPQRCLNQLTEGDRFHSLPHCDTLPVIIVHESSHFVNCQGIFTRALPHHSLANPAFRGRQSADFIPRRHASMADAGAVMPRAGAHLRLLSISAWYQLYPWQYMGK